MQATGNPCGDRAAVTCAAPAAGWLYPLYPAHHSPVLSQTAWSILAKPSWHLSTRCRAGGTSLHRIHPGHGEPAPFPTQVVHNLPVHHCLIAAKMGWFRETKTFLHLPSFLSIVKSQAAVRTVTHTKLQAVQECKVHTHSEGCSDTSVPGHLRQWHCSCFPARDLQSLVVHTGVGEDSASLPNSSDSTVKAVDLNLLPLTLISLLASTLPAQLCSTLRTSLHPAVLRSRLMSRDLLL